MEVYIIRSSRQQKMKMYHFYKRDTKRTFKFAHNHIIADDMISAESILKDNFSNRYYTMLLLLGFYFSQIFLILALDRSSYFQSLT